MKNYRQSRPRTSFATYTTAVPFEVGSTVTTPYGESAKVTLSTESITRVTIGGVIKAYDTSALKQG